MMHIEMAAKLCLFTVYFMVIMAQADQIVLTNGQSATVRIIDTTGCSLKMIRNSNEVTIKKKNIDYIIWNSDTISYKYYQCTETPVKAVRFQDTPEYHLMVLVDKAPRLDQVFRKNTLVAYCTMPLQGSYNLSEFVGIMHDLTSIISEYTTTQEYSPEELMKELAGSNHKFDYIFFARQYHVIISRIPEKKFSPIAPTGMRTGTPQPSIKQKELITTADFLIYDVSSKEIVYRHRNNAKRSVWGESEYSWTNLITPENLRKEWDEAKTERVLDRNATEITRDEEKELRRYFSYKN